MQLAFDKSKFLQDLDAQQAEGAIDVALTSGGKSHIRDFNGMRSIPSPSRFALGHLVDAIAGEGAAQRLTELSTNGRVDVETYPLDRHLASVTAIACGHFTVVIRLRR